MIIPDGSNSYNVGFLSFTKPSLLIWYLQSHFLSVNDKESFLREYGSISFFPFQTILIKAPGSISDIFLTIE